MPASLLRMRAPGKQTAAFASSRACERAQARLVRDVSPEDAEFFGKGNRDYPLAELRDYIDWSPFFATWELVRQIPAILDDAKLRMSRAQRLCGCAGHARPHLRGGWLRAHGLRIWPCEFRGRRHLSMPTMLARSLAVLRTLRQQLIRREGRANVALADFVAPLRAASQTTSVRSWSPLRSARGDRGALQAGGR